MKLQLMRLRKEAGFKSRKALADALGDGYTERRIKSWEDEERMLSLKQACDIADVLECTLDELAGREWDSTEFYSDAFQAELNRCYEACTPDRRAGILQVARDGALASGEASQRAAHAPEGFVSAEVDLYRRAVAGERVSDSEVRSAIEEDARRMASMGEREQRDYIAWKEREMSKLVGKNAGEGAA